MASCDATTHAGVKKSSIYPVRRAGESRLTGCAGIDAAAACQMHRTSRRPPHCHKVQHLITTGIWPAGPPNPQACGGESPGISRHRLLRSRPAVPAVWRLHRALRRRLGAAGLEMRAPRRQRLGAARQTPVTHCTPAVISTRATRAGSARRCASRAADRRRGSGGAGLRHGQAQFVLRNAPVHSPPLPGAEGVRHAHGPPRCAGRVLSRWQHPHERHLRCVVAQSQRLQQRDDLLLSDIYGRI